MERGDPLGMAVAELASGVVAADLHAQFESKAVSLGNQDDTDVQVPPLPTLPPALLVSNPLANSGAVPPSQQSSSSAPAAASDPRRHNGKAPRYLEQDHGQPQPMAIRQNRPPAAKAPPVQPGAADVQLPAVNAITPLRLSAWAGRVLGSDHTNMARSICWGVHSSKLVVQQKPTEGPEGLRRRMQGVRSGLQSLLFTEVDGESVLGPLAPAGLAYQNEQGQSTLRTVDVNRDDIVAREERISPVDTDRVRFTRK